MENDGGRCLLWAVGFGYDLAEARSGVAASARGKYRHVGIDCRLDDRIGLDCRSDPPGEYRVVWWLYC